MSGKSKSRLDQRIQDLEKEIRRLEGDTKSLTKAIHDPRGKPLPLIQDGHVPLPEDTTLHTSRNREVPSDRSSAERQSGHAPGMRVKPHPLSGDPSASRDFRFATYLSAKGLSYGKASRQDRNIQRNKALLMLVVVIMVLYVVLKLAT